MEGKYQIPEAARQGRWPSLAIVVASLLAIVYLLQLPSPLRLNTDSVILLSIGASAADGHGFLYHGGATHFPPGYPAMLALLDWLGLASSQSFIILNCAFLGATLAASFLLYRNPLGFTVSTSVGLCCIVMLSYVLVKHMTIPLSDVPFMGLFTPALLLLERSRHGSDRIRWIYLFWAVLLAGLATTVRTAGLALLPAFAWVMGQPVLGRVRSIKKDHPILLWSCLAAILIVGLSCGFLISETRYFQEMKGQYFEVGLVNRLQENVGVHTLELGELGINLPSAKVPSVLKPVFMVAGMLVVALLFRAIRLRRRSFGVLEITLLAYSAEIFVWPYQDARFWLPALPLIVGFIGVSMMDLASHRHFRFIVPAAFGWLALTGLVALAYSTRISWAGKRFPDLYGDGTLTPSYRAAFLGQTNLKVNSDIVTLLKRYDPKDAKIVAAK